MKQVPELTLLAVINGGQRSPEAFQYHHFQAVQAPPELRHPTYRGTACKAPDMRNKAFCWTDFNNPICAHWAYAETLMAVATA